jgi:fatty acid desaturase
MTRLPQRGNARPSGQRESQPPTVAIALFVGFVLAAAFTGLAAVVIPGVLLMVLAGFGMLIFFALQYFLWAKWLYPIVMKMETDSSKANKQLPDTMPGIHSEIDS